MLPCACLKSGESSDNEADRKAESIDSSGVTIPRYTVSIRR